ncbi:DMT family transporter [Actinomadura vinacea]|uniref:DMT family transporter n=1 Tax=Actinomadura vinacea TaxID=115336 RepID=A0ABN3KFS9_9ACTN
MSHKDSATAPGSIAVQAASESDPGPGPGFGLGLAGLGVLVFSLTFPATAFGLEGLDPYLIGIGRSAAATVLAVVALLAFRGGSGSARRPRGRQWGAVAVTAAGVIFGFPVLSTLALEHGSSSAHAAVVVGLLPATTAVFAVVRAGERPSPMFWLAGAAGAVLVTGFAVIRGAGHVTAADLLLFGALLSAAVGYTEGGRLAREMPGWRVISWALVLVAPITVPVTGRLLATTDPQWTGRSAFGFGYVALLSAYLGFFAWYEGLARAGIARASQVQLSQPLLTLLWSGILLGELIDGFTALAAVGVLVCVALTQRARVGNVRVQAVPDGSELAECDTFTHDGKESVTSS